MNKKLWLILIVIVAAIVGAIFISNINFHTKRSDAQSASGEWRWENFSDEEIDKWSHIYPPSYFFLLNMWGKTEHKTLLDVGAGLGSQSIGFAEKGLDVSSVDINPFSMDRLAKIAAEKNLPIKTKAGDARNLPYSDKSFDFVYANDVVNLSGCDAIPGIIAELARVTKDGGQIFFTLNAEIGDDNPINKKESESLHHDDCVPGKNKHEQICSYKNEFKTVYCFVNQAMLENLLKPYKVKSIYMEFDMHPSDLSGMSAHYHIVIGKK